VRAIVARPAWFVANAFSGILGRQPVPEPIQMDDDPTTLKRNKFLFNQNVTLWKKREPHNERNDGHQHAVFNSSTSPNCELRTRAATH
jgi:hypothetical protein